MGLKIIFKQFKTIKMNILSQFGHQGDTQWFNIKKIPNNLKPIEKKFIAASERSGSFHALFGDYDMYETEDGLYIDAKEDCILNHSLQKELAEINMDLAVELPKKDHRKSVIPKGKYFVGIQNRFDPMRNLKQRVKD